MAKFAQYIQLYKNTYEPDLFVDDPEIGCKNEWPRRQEIFKGYLKDDNAITFKPTDDKVDEKTGEIKKGTTYPHRVWHSSLNDGIIVMRFANVKDMIIEQDFEEKHVEHNPSCYVIFDSRDNCRRVHIQKIRSSFSSTDQVARIIQEVFNKNLMNDRHEFEVEFRAQRYPRDFYKLYEVQKDNTSLIRFNVSDYIVRDGNETEYLLSIEEMSRENDVKTTVELSSKREGEVLRVNVTGKYVKSLVHASAGSASTIELVTIDGARFECYLNSDLETDDKIVSVEVDIEMLDMLFCKDEEVVKRAEAKLVDFLNLTKREVNEEEEHL